MESTVISIQLHSPIWTGGAGGRPQGLKCSGVIGGMRQAFEMLVRKAGGHTCNITGDSNQRCNYEKDPDVCPACRLFGCTGLARAFKISFAPVLENTKLLVPETDPNIHNRPHYTVAEFTSGQVPNKDWYKKNSNHIEYSSPCSIDTWLAGCLGLPSPRKHKKSKTFMATINLTHSSQKVNMRITWIRPLGVVMANQGDLVIYLLKYMSLSGGLGAKVRQGWGTFDVLEGQASSLCERGSTSLVKLIEACNFQRNWDEHLPSAADCFAVEWDLQSDDLKFTWPNPKRHPIDSCRQIGYAMNYRLRRHVKFYEVDNPGSAIPGLADPQWRNIGNGLPPPHGRCPWRATLPFVRAVFGRDDAGDRDKHAGLVGVSHLFQRHDSEHWHIRLFGRLPSQYAYRQDDQRVPVQILQWNRTDVHQYLVKEMDALLKQTAASPVGIAKHLLKEEFGHEL
jgi:CRISPR type III-B/RAMP module RAMP protein Cmr1